MSDTALQLHTETTAVARIFAAMYLTQQAVAAGGTPKDEPAAAYGDAFKTIYRAICEAANVK